MASPELAPQVLTFYTSLYDEGSRLTSSADGRLELLRTQELLRRFLPEAPARVLDVGGGTGVHARWLVADGYEVRLVDQSALTAARLAEPYPELLAASSHLLAVGRRAELN